MKKIQFFLRNPLILTALLFLLFPASAHAHSRMDGLALIGTVPPFFIIIGLFTFIGVLQTIIKREKVRWLRLFIRSIFVLAAACAFHFVLNLYVIDHNTAGPGELMACFGLFAALYLPVFLLSLIIIAVVRHVVKKHDRQKSIQKNISELSEPESAANAPVQRTEKKYLGLLIKSIIALVLFWKTTHHFVYNPIDGGIHHETLYKLFLLPLLGLYLPVLLFDVMMLIFDKRREGKKGKDVIGEVGSGG